MMLSVNTLEQKLKNNIGTVKKVEKAIDKELEKSFDGEHAIFVVPEEYIQLHTRVKKEILDKYREVGWDVKYKNTRDEKKLFYFTINDYYSRCDNRIIPEGMR